jgi:hypothetical protein
MTFPAAIFFCITIFSLLVGHMAVGEKPSMSTGYNIHIRRRTNVCTRRYHRFRHHLDPCNDWGSLPSVNSSFDPQAASLIALLQVVAGAPLLFPPQAGPHRYSNSRAVCAGCILALYVYCLSNLTYVAFIYQ